MSFYTINCHYRVFTSSAAGRTGPDGLADLPGLQVVVDDIVYDVGELAAQHHLAHLHQVRAEQVTQPLTDAVHPLDHLVLCGVAGQPRVDVGDDVDADGAEEVLPGHTRTGSRHTQQQHQGHGHRGLHHLQRYMSTPM